MNVRRDGATNIEANGLTHDEPGTNDRRIDDPDGADRTCVRMRQCYPLDHVLGIECKRSYYPQPTPLGNRVSTYRDLRDLSHDLCQRRRRRVD